MTIDRVNYWHFYGLKQQPFLPIKDITACYLPPRWEHSFDVLQHLCRTSNSLLVVTGVKQSGKTIFGQLFINQLDDTVKSCKVNASPNMTPAQLQLALVQGFALTESLGDSLEEQLYYHLTTLQHRPQLSLLIIDDAHTLPVESLQVLFYLLHQQSETQMRLHILLLGLPELKTRVIALNDQNNVQEIINSFELGLFNFEETTAYLQYHVHLAGVPAALPFSKADQTNIYKNSAGQPNKINFYAEQLLLANIKKRRLFAMLDFAERNKTKFIHGLLSLIMATILLVLVNNIKHASISLADVKQLFNKIHFAHTVTKEHLAVNAVQSVHESKPVAPKPVLSLKFSSPIHSHDHLQTVPAHTVKNFFSYSVSEKLYASYAKIITSGWKIMSQHQHLLTFGEPTRFFNFATSLPAFTWVSTSALPQVATQPIIFDPSWQLIRAEKQHWFESLPQKNARVVQAGQKDVVKPTKRVTAKVNAVQIASKVSKPVTTLGHHNLLAVNPDHYTLQLIGLSNKQALDAFISRNKLSGNVGYYQSHLQGKEWYVLLYGEFTSPQEAKVALQQLPQAVRDQKPWVRTMANVQASIRKQQNLYANLTK